ncbi:alanine racemase [Eupransor demetentiae]|uniref:Alanine racemase n=1 Tax=Eupransor demetentiae TaxID=3109584 RepID=A0ABM9N6G2_9LACO|nr:Alanine racemase (Alr) [Lactobacillaceae bacterium LMG 33000]
MTATDLLTLRPTWMEVDLEAIQTNALKVMKHAGAKNLIAVVKANAYGHDVKAVSQALWQIGVRRFAVATIFEGITLREYLPQDDARIIMLGVQPAEHADLMVNYRLEPAVGTTEWLDQAAQVIGAGRPPLRIQLAVDTGMGRMGANSEEAVSQMYQRILADEHFELGGVFTHFATADDHNQAYYDGQRERFTTWVEKAGIPRRYWHMANSGSALWHPEQIDTETIRVGSVLYGFNPGAPELKSPVELQPAAGLYSRLGSVHELKAGESVSYGATYTAKEDQWVGTLPIGYADGYIRRLGGMKVLINGRVEHVIGRITMDQIIVSLSQPEEVGTKVTLLGRDGDQEIKIEDLAEHAGTIPHELLTEFSSRLPRIIK